MIGYDIDLPVLLVEPHLVGRIGCIGRWPWCRDVLALLQFGRGIVAERELRLEEVVREEGVLVVGFWELHAMMIIYNEMQIKGR